MTEFTKAYFQRHLDNGLVVSSRGPQLPVPMLRYGALVTPKISYFHGTATLEWFEAASDRITEHGAWLMVPKADSPDADYYVRIDIAVVSKTFKEVCREAGVEVPLFRDVFDYLRATRIHPVYLAVAEILDKGYRDLYVGAVSHEKGALSDIERWNRRRFGWAMVHPAVTAQQSTHPELVATLEECIVYDDRRVNSVLYEKRKLERRDRVQVLLQEKFGKTLEGEELDSFITAIANALVAG